MSHYDKPFKFNNKSRKCYTIHVKEMRFLNGSIPIDTSEVVITPWKELYRGKNAVVAINKVHAAWRDVIRLDKSACIFRRAVIEGDMF
jgi:hypothetical protein